jgi:hypothetical protein
MSTEKCGESGKCLLNVTETVIWFSWVSNSDNYVHFNAKLKSYSIIDLEDISNAQITND